MKRDSYAVVEYNKTLMSHELKQIEQRNPRTQLLLYLYSQPTYHRKYKLEGIWMYGDPEEQTRTHMKFLIGRSQVQQHRQDQFQSVQTQKHVSCSGR